MQISGIYGAGLGRFRAAKRLESQPPRAPIRNLEVALLVTRLERDTKCQFLRSIDRERPAALNWEQTRSPSLGQGGRSYYQLSHTALTLTPTMIGLTTAI